MKTQVESKKAWRQYWRMTCACGAALALLLAVSGCDDSIRETLRQGALDVFETTVETAYSQLTTNATTAIQEFDLGGVATATGGGG
ncbi:MAG: hypothetical protein ABIG44_16250 [Planctomycetota bacterium]